MRVGVIVAARAPVPYLDEAVRSVMAQTGEIVLVDHASEPALEGPPGVRVVRLRDGGGGPAAARQAGLEALGDEVEVVALADADDVWQPGKLEAQLAALASHSSAAVCFGRAVVIDERGRETGEKLPELGAGLHSAESLRARLYESNPIPAASAVVRREALEAVGGFRLGSGELPAGSDWDLWLRLVAAGHDFVCEPAAQIRYRRHSGGLTADVARLAEAGLEIHSRHKALVDQATAKRAKAADLRTLARGRVRQRRYDEARAALAEAEKLEPPDRQDQLLKAGLTVPGLRALLGRRNPYR
jgi:glycosyltransferase involved in cell wall biosynthesis